MANCLIVGASRGIGRELARQFLAQGDRVTATVRRRADGAPLQALGAQIVELDLLRDDWLPLLAGALDATALDVVIVAAGIAGPQVDGLVAPARADFDAVMHTNVLATMQLAPFLRDGQLGAGAKFAVLTSRMGSIGGTTNPSWWLYRASKAALNSALKSASTVLGPRGVVCIALHPGWVRTDMGGGGADLAVEESAAALLRVITAANRSHNGHFLNYNGEQLEW